MIFGWDRVSSDDFNCYDKIVIADVNFIGRRPICGLYIYMGREASGSLYEDNDSESSISS